MILAKKQTPALIVAALTFGLAFAAPIPSMAQSAAMAHKKNWVQRHPTATAIGAAALTHHALKVAAARDKARGKRLNWAERHPTLSAIGVGVATHHIIKKHTPQ